jgi:hypothetical protein
LLTASATGAVPIEIACPAGAGACHGTVTLRTLTAVGAGASPATARKSILTLATASFSVAGGRATSAMLHLSLRARALLARSSTLRAVATIVAHDQAGASHTTRTTVTLRVRRARSGRR